MDDTRVPDRRFFAHRGFSDDSPATVSQPETSLTCTDCGGPLEPGRSYRCLACASALWIALEERYGVEWAARHRSRG